MRDVCWSTGPGQRCQSRRRQSQLPVQLQLSKMPLLAFMPRESFWDFSLPTSDTSESASLRVQEQLSKMAEAAGSMLRILSISDFATLALSMITRPSGVKVRSSVEKSSYLSAIVTSIAIGLHIKKCIAKISYYRLHMRESENTPNRCKNII
jgi:hypothetical protein